MVNPPLSKGLGAIQALKKEGCQDRQNQIGMEGPYRPVCNSSPPGAYEGVQIPSFWTSVV